MVASALVSFSHCFFKEIGKRNRRTLHKIVHIVQALCNKKRMRIMGTGKRATERWGTKLVLGYFSTFQFHVCFESEKRLNVYRCLDYFHGWI